MIRQFSLQVGLHRFPHDLFGSVRDLQDPRRQRDNDTLVVSCVEQGTAPDNISLLTSNRLVIVQNLGASIPSRTDCEDYDGLACDDLERLFARHRFRHVIVCGHLNCRVIPFWLRPSDTTHTDTGNFRQRFAHGTQALVDNNYQPNSADERRELMICEHVLCQIENLLTHDFVEAPAGRGETLLYGWVVDDDTARVFGYNCEESAFVPI